MVNILKNIFYRPSVHRIGPINSSLNIQKRQFSILIDRDKMWNQDWIFRSSFHLTKQQIAESKSYFTPELNFYRIYIHVERISTIPTKILKNEKMYLPLLILKKTKCIIKPVWFPHKTKNNNRNYGSYSSVYQDCDIEIFTSLYYVSRSGESIKMYMISWIADNKRINFWTFETFPTCLEWNFINSLKNKLKNFNKKIWSVQI